MIYSFVNNDKSVVNITHCPQYNSRKLPIYAVNCIVHRTRNSSGINDGIDTSNSFCNKRKRCIISKRIYDYDFFFRGAN